MTAATVRSLSAKELATLVRRDLKAAFPAQKFSVTSDHYSMGSAVRVSWTDGPTVTPVEAIADRYCGVGFDGSQDLKTYHPIVVDGETCSASSWITCARSQTHVEWQAAIAERVIRERCTVEGDRFGNDWVRDLAHRMVRELGTDQPSFEVAFRRGALREGDAAEACGAFERADDEGSTFPEYERCAACKQQRLYHAVVVRPSPPDDGTPVINFHAGDLVHLGVAETIEQAKDMLASNAISAVEVRGVGVSWTRDLDSGAVTKWNEQEGGAMQKDAKTRTKVGAARASDGRCPTCGALRNKKDLACFRCRVNARDAKRFATGSAPITPARKKK